MNIAAAIGMGVFLTSTAAITLILTWRAGRAAAALRRDIPLPAALWCQLRRARHPSWWHVPARAAADGAGTLTAGQRQACIALLKNAIDGPHVPGPVYRNDDKDGETA